MVISFITLFFIMSFFSSLTLQDLVDKTLGQVNGHRVLLSHTGFGEPASLCHQHCRVPILQLYPAQNAPQVRGHSLPVLDQAPAQTEVVRPEGQSKEVGCSLHPELLLRGECGQEGPIPDV